MLRAKNLQAIGEKLQVKKNNLEAAEIIQMGMIRPRIGQWQLRWRGSISKIFLKLLPYVKYPR